MMPTNTERCSLSRWQAVNRAAQNAGWACGPEGDFGIGHTSMMYMHPQFGTIIVSYNRDQITSALAIMVDGVIEITGPAAFYRTILALHGVI